MDTVHSEGASGVHLRRGPLRGVWERPRPPRRTPPPRSDEQMRAGGTKRQRLISARASAWSRARIGAFPSPGENFSKGAVRGAQPGLAALGLLVSAQAGKILLMCSWVSRHFR